MADANNWFAPSERALDYGSQYAKVLGQWGALFTSASELVENNITLGRMAVDSASEFEKWFRDIAAGPWAWMSPDALQRTMRQFGVTPPASPGG